MNQDLTTALIGLGGAAVGAAASLLTTGAQLRHSRRSAEAARREAREERLHDIGRGAAEEAYAKLMELLEYLEAVRPAPGPPDHRPEWAVEALTQIRSVALAVARIPGDEVMDRFTLPHDLAKGFRHAGPREMRQVQWMLRMVQDMILILTGYLKRSSELPPSDDLESFQERYERGKEQERRRYERWLQDERDAQAEEPPEPDDAPF
ncbi:MULTISPECIES: hypothetical protein [Streptomyces]|uniref:Secreted protein n=1 Tax=Streptomyces evansiae TaxID=3075535 RepID=A0ABU2R442_9ACTN|nr:MULTISPECIES: hypothetical protein [unclassified Streptomyces]MDT0410465.1 hypothetical protein [Streptomyces sp. DSM 41979]